MHNAFALLLGCLHARPEYAAGDQVSRRVQNGDRSGAEPHAGSIMNFLSPNNYESTSIFHYFTIYSLFFFFSHGLVLATLKFV